MTSHALSTSPVTISYRNYTNVSFPFMRGYEPGDTMVAGWSGSIDADTLEVTRWPSSCSTATTATTAPMGSCARR